MSNQLVIRADANVQIGIGHVMRCLALAQAWQDSGGSVAFATAYGLPESLRQRLISEGMKVQHLVEEAGSVADANATIALAQKLGASHLVIDGYHFGVDYQQRLKNAELRLLFIDDNGHAEHYYADWVLNQNLHASETMYASREPYTQLLLGTHYALLRREYWKWRGWQREIPSEANKVLVTMGGSDPDNVTLKVIEALLQVQIEGLDAIVVVGDGNPHFAQLQTVVGARQHNIRLETKVRDMPALIAWADLAVSAAGTTCWELAFMGLPNIILPLADNQYPTAEALNGMQVALNLCGVTEVTAEKLAKEIETLSVTTQKRCEMSQRGRNLVDGEGADRTEMWFSNSQIRLREAHEVDCDRLWNWANDSSVRASAFSSEPISWQTHRTWFASKLNDPNVVIFIALDQHNVPIGQVRFDMFGDGEAEIDVSIDRLRRRSGYGTILIDRVIRRIFATKSLRVVHAFIKPENEGSIRTFEKAQFEKMGSEQKNGVVALHYALVVGKSA